MRRVAFLSTTSVRALLTAWSLGLVMISGAHAQTPGPPSTPTVPVVSACGSLSLSPGSVWTLSQDATGDLCAGVTVSATASIAAFAPTGQAALNASNSSSNVALGSVGPTALVTNNGTVTAFVNFGGSGVTATTSSYPVNAGQSIAFNVGSNTYIAGITASSTAALSITTGTGLPAIANGSGSSAGTTSVNVAQISGNTTLTGAGATGTGSQRETVAQDTTTIAGSAPGTAGSASSNVVTVQGISGGTNLPVSQATAANLNATVIGVDPGPISATATPANSSHAAGTSIGGLFTIPIGPAPASGNSGIITQFALKSVGGSTGSLAVRIWQKAPTNTTCTDNTAFAGSDTDDAFLITPPFSITPAAPASTTGDSATYASAQNLVLDYKNADSPATANLYACLVTVATDTADENKLVRVTLSGPTN